MKTIDIAIVIGNSIFTGFGFEFVLLNYIKHKPEFVNLTVIQTDLLYYNTRNLEKNYIPQLNNFKMITIKTNKHGNTIFNMLSAYHKNKHLLEEYNIVYFPAPFLSLPFKKNEKQIFVLGGHGVSTSKGVGRKLKLLLNTHIYKKINYYHQLYAGEAVENGFLGSIFTVPNGIDTNVFYPLTCKINKNKFLFVGRLEESKGVKILVESWKKAEKYNQASLTIIGNGPLRNYIEENLKFNIIYKHSITILELANIYRNSDYFLNPTMNDTFSMVTMEALSSGLFIIASKVLEKIYSDYKNNLNIEFVKPEINEFSEQIRNVVETPPSWDRGKQNEYINQNFNWEKIAEVFYDKIIKIWYEFNNKNFQSIDQKAF